ncbi:MAG: helix-hairpin-helix domain-containing protein [Paludibacteraceae bacterium]|nr:helix-hairpin-helix domain-containing protein [Paludibacteraceae bacterium]
MSWQDYWTFNRSERRGIIVLLVFIFIFLILSHCIDYFDWTEKEDMSKYADFIANFEANINELDSNPDETRLNRYISEKYDTLQLFEFDPNTTSEADFIELGLTTKQIETITNYIDKGGRFYDPDDFRKMYGIRQKQYEYLEEYIRIEQKSTDKANYKKHDKKHDENVYPKNNVRAEIIHEIKPVDFDPNTITQQELMQMGLPDKVVENIINFRSKGGAFNSPDDMRKIYAVDSVLFAELAPYVKISVKKKERNIAKVELNSATYDELIAIRGIGKYFATEIIKFREKYSGIVNIDQLLEIYGMTDEKFAVIKEYVAANPDLAKRMDINKLTTSELLKHPYIDYAIASQIVAYRNKHGDFVRTEQLMETKILIKPVFDKIKYYLCVNCK